MRFSATILLAAAGLAAAQTATGSAASSVATGASNGCIPGSETIVDACLGSTRTQAEACPANDWVCMCTQYKNVLTCYDNCVSLPERSTVQNQVTAYCQAAAPLLSSSSAAAATRSSTASAASTASTMATSASQSGSSSSSTASGSEASASATGAAAGLYVPAGGLVAVALGAFGML